MDMFPYLVLISALVGTIIGFGINRKLARPTIARALLWSACVTLMIVMALGLSLVLADHLRAQMLYPKYTATIIDYESEWKDQDDGPDVLMHSPILQFTDQSGEEITRKSSTFSSLKPIIGDTQTVYFKNGKLYEPSAFLYGILGLFISISGYFVTYAAFFALGRDRRRLESIGVRAVSTGIIPGALLLMSLSMFWAVFDYGFGRNQAELSAGTAIALTILGALTLRSLASYIRLMIKGNPPKLPKQK